MRRKKAEHAKRKEQCECVCKAVGYLRAAGDYTMMCVSGELDYSNQTRFTLTKTKGTKTVANVAASASETIIPGMNLQDRTHVLGSEAKNFYGKALDVLLQWLPPCEECDVMKEALLHALSSARAVET